MKTFQQLSEKLKKDKDDPCWKGYVQVGTKKKNGKEVPNCVPKEGVEEEKDTHKTKDGRTAKKGLWYNINQKKKRGEAPAKKGDPDYPKTLNIESIEEKAVSKQQQKFMGMVRAVQKGEMDAPSPEVAKAAKSMSKTDVKDFAKTKHKGLPDKKEVDENRYSPLQMAKAKKEREERRKKDTRAGETQSQRLQRKVYGNMMGGLKKEEVELDEAFSDKEIKMAIGVASDKRYAKGNMTGAVNAIEKIKKGLSDHPQVKAVLRRQNESLDEAAPKLKGNDGPYTRQQIEKAAKEAKVDIGAKARMMMALRKM